MPAINPSITETNLFATLGDFIAGLIDPSVEIVRGLQNGVPMPAGAFIAMSPVSNVPLDRSVSAYTDTSRDITRAMQWTAQVDCYGDGSQDRAAMLCEIMNTDYATDVFAASGFDIAPLYASEPMQLPLITGEQQYLERWTFNAVLQYNPTVSVAQQSATQITVGTINVDVTYP